MPRHELNKDNSNSHGKVDRGKFMRPQPYTKNHMQLENQRVEEIVFPAEGESGRSMGKGKIIIKMYYI